MASKRFEEFLKNASPEMKAKIAETGKEAFGPGGPKPPDGPNPPDAPKMPDGIKVNQPSEYSDQSPDRRADVARPYAAPPEPSYNTTEKQPERRIDRAMTEKAEAKTAEPSKEPAKETPAKEQER